MYEHKDLTPITRIAIGALLISMVIRILFALGTFYVKILSPMPELTTPSLALALVTLVYGLSFLITMILVGRWIYCASVNAHALSGDMTIRPGWAVGWYFVPIANLFKPYRAMKEIWLASCGEHETDSSLLGWWWGLWILDNILQNLSWQISSGDPQFGAYLDLVSDVANVPLTLILISIIRQIGKGQDLAIHEGIFA